VRPVPWPAGRAPRTRSWPAWRNGPWRMGHPAIPEDVRGVVHELARQHGQSQFLPDEEDEGRAT
jgi:hypothetical protein